VYSEESTKSITDVFIRVTERGAWAPGLWRSEVANVRRGRHDTAFRDATLADLALLPISIDADTDRHAWGATLRIAERHKLTLYDAAYLELAQRRGLPLATLDNDLSRAAGIEATMVIS
jgi:predicted nucleic acid-binding protein